MKLNQNILKICIFPNDPIISYLQKGEIKNRYYNPKNLFDEVHFISFIDKDVEENKVQEIVGGAKLTIHAVGKIRIKDREHHKDRIIELIKKINPDIIRAYNPYLEGWFAATCSKILKIPFFLSLHTQYDRNRMLAKRSNLKKYLSLKYTEKFIEPFVIKNADKITIVYRIIEPYVKKHGGKNLELLHNNVDLERFQKAIQINSLPKPLILSVGSLIKEKNHQCLIEAMKEIDAHLLIIGNGEIYEDLMKSIKKNNLQEKIIIKKSVPNNEIQNFYKSATVFALCYDPELEGIPIPTIEAMACGIPVIIPSPKEGFSEGLENAVIFSERTPRAFAEKINQVLVDEKLRDNFSKNAFEKSKLFDVKNLEEKESKIYKDLLKDNL